MVSNMFAVQYCTVLQRIYYFVHKPSLGVQVVPAGQALHTAPKLKKGVIQLFFDMVVLCKVYSVQCTPYLVCT